MSGVSVLAPPVSVFYTTQGVSVTPAMRPEAVEKKARRERKEWGDGRKGHYCTIRLIAGAPTSPNGLIPRPTWR